MSSINAQNINPVHDRVLVIDMEFGQKKSKGGIFLGNDDGKSQGVRPRWAKVFKVGPEQEELKVGDYILLAHGRWSRAFEVEINGQKKKLFMIDYPLGLLAISRSKPKELDLVDL